MLNGKEGREGADVPGLFLLYTEGCHGMVEQACSQVSTVSAKVQAHEWLSHQQPKTSGFFCAIFGVFATFFFFFSACSASRRVKI